MTVPEVCRLLRSITEPPERFPFRLAWSTFRRRHQATANQYHAARRVRGQRGTGSGPQVQVLRPANLELTDERWAHICPLLPPQKPATGRPNHDHRRILAGILWVVRTGASWRDLPAHFGPWETVHSRYRRWCKAGIWQLILDALMLGDPADLP